MVRSPVLQQSVTISEFARRGGVGVETVRFYQRRHLLAKPNKTGATGRVRRYGEEDLRRLKFIRSAQGAGFTLEEIRELLTLDSGTDRTRVRAIAERRIAALNDKVRELNAARRALERLCAECSATRTGPCPILLAF